MGGGMRAREPSKHCLQHWHSQTLSRLRGLGSAARKGHVLGDHALCPIRRGNCCQLVSFCDTQGEHEASSGNQSDKLLLFSSKLGNVAILESSSMHFGQKALRTTAGVEPLLFACVAAVQGRCTDAANKHKAGGVGMDMLWIA